MNKIDSHNYSLKIFFTTIILFFMFFGCSHKLPSHKQAKAAMKQYLSDKGIRLSQEKDHPAITIVGIREHKKECLVKIKYHYWDWKSIHPSWLHDKKRASERMMKKNGALKCILFWGYNNNWSEVIEKSEIENKLKEHWNKRDDFTIFKKKSFIKWAKDKYLDNSEKFKSIYSNQIPFITEKILSENELEILLDKKINKLSNDDKSNLLMDFLYAEIKGGVSILVQSKSIDYKLVKYDTGWICEGLYREK